jgi:uncharacterized hydrophobic protein (TIGR00271 family)
VIHVRAVSPPATTSRLLDALRVDDDVVNIIVLPGAVGHPDGDAVQFDVTNASANRALALLRRLGLDHDGSIIVENIDAALAPGRVASRDGRGRFDEFAPVWEEVEARIHAGGLYPPSWYMLLVIAGMIGAVGILTNSPILIVGAMVVGPEYGAMIDVALGLNKRDGKRVRSGLFALALGFSMAIVAAALLGVFVRAIDRVPSAFASGVRPVSDLIDAPNIFSVVVALLAGIVGVLSLAEARTSALIGVFVSVTTIPAAADMGVSAAFASWSELGGSAVQLLVNVVILTAVGSVGLLVQRRFWDRRTRAVKSLDHT